MHKKKSTKLNNKELPYFYKNSPETPYLNRPQTCKNWIHFGGRSKSAPIGHGEALQPN